MFFLRKPDYDAVQRYIQAQRSTNLTYSAVGSTRDVGSNKSGAAEAGFNVDHNRILLGYGADLFEKGKSALKTWKMFDVGWVEPLFESPLLHDGIHLQHDQTSSSSRYVGTPLALRIRHLGFWSLNSARIVYAFDEPRNFGFAYGTLADHSESGEECFYVEWLDDDSVWFGIYAFSRPRNILARIGKPLARMLQRRFVRQALQAMRRAVAL